MEPRGDWFSKSGKWLLMETNSMGKIRKTISIAKDFLTSLAWVAFGVFAILWILDNFGLEVALIAAFGYWLVTNPNISKE